jgi:hypothetical protein
MSRGVARDRFRNSSVRGRHPLPGTKCIVFHNKGSPMTISLHRRHTRSAFTWKSCLSFAGLEFATPISMILFSNSSGTLEIEGMEMVEFNLSRGNIGQGFVGSCFQFTFPETSTPT